MGHVIGTMDTQRRPPVIDMTPEGEFRDPVPPRAMGGLDRFLARMGGIAMLVAIGAAGLALAGLALLAIGVLLPVALIAGLIGGGSLWWRMRKAGRGGAQPVRFVIIRR